MWAVVVVQLVEQLLPTLDVCSSNLIIGPQKTIGTAKRDNLDGWHQCDQIGRFLHFGQPFKTGGNKYFTQIAHIVRQFL